MFIGQKDLTIDDKNRLVLPSNYRKDFQGDQLYATLGMDPCLRLFSVEEYQKTAESIAQYNDFDPNARRLKRAFLSNTFAIAIDGHSRILLPRPLIDRIGLGKKVTLVGMSNCLEVWDSERYAKVSVEEQENYSTNAEAYLQRHG